MNDASSPRKARFHIGDQVRVIGPTVQAGEEKSGRVTDVIGSGAGKLIEE
jgi:hypothetical protein